MPRPSRLSCRRSGLPALFSVALALLAAAAPPRPAAAAEGYWELAEVTSFLQPDYQTRDCYPWKAAGGPGHTTYEQQNVCLDPAGAFGLFFSWSPPPARLVPGESVTLSASAAIVANDQRLNLGANFTAAFDAAACGGTSRRIEIFWITISNGGRYPRADQVKDAAARVPGSDWPAGIAELGGRLKLTVCTTAWETDYFYAWHEGAQPATAAAPPKVMVQRIEEPAPALPPGVEDSGARFSDLYGQVEWRPHDEEEAWQFAKYDQVLPVDAHIRTSEKSGAIISFADMTTFVLKPDSEIILSSPAQKDSQVKLLGGQLWTNFKRMLKDGSMEIEMSQAVTGIKGTLLHSREQAGRSTVAVCEGVVSVTNRQTGEAVTLAPGDRAVAAGATLALEPGAAAALCAAVPDSAAAAALAAELEEEAAVPAPPAAPVPPMVAIPAGRFLMGSDGSPEGELYPESDEQPRHEVAIAAFELGATEVTLAQWRSVMGADPSGYVAAPDDAPPELMPAVGVTFNEARVFIKRLNEMTGETYRLPTEAEWEYAARAGSAGAFHFGDDWQQLADYAWYEANSEGHVHPVAQKLPNPHGLYDLHGNVEEWTQDCYRPSYAGAPADGSAVATDEEGSGACHRVVRGGSWYSYAEQDLRAGARSGAHPGGLNDVIGLRLAR